MTVSYTHLALPFFMGVELMDSMGQGGNTAESISTALKSISDPCLLYTSRCV